MGPTVLGPLQLLDVLGPLPVVEVVHKYWDQLPVVEVGPLLFGTRLPVGEGSILYWDQLPVV